MIEVSTAEKGWSKRLMTFFVELSLVVCLVEGRGPWKVGLGMSKLRREE